MTNKKALIVIGVAVLSLIISGLVFVKSDTGEAIIGAIGTNPVENYIPIIKHNEGYYSQLPVTTTGAFTAGGDATISGGTLNVSTSNSATSTIIVGCMQFYATSTETPHKFQASTTPGVMVSTYGTCPNL